MDIAKLQPVSPSDSYRQSNTADDQGDQGGGEMRIASVNS